MARTRRTVQNVSLRNIVFGELVPCERCKQTGTYIGSDNKKVPCPYCEARGYREWRTNAVDGHAGAPQ